jgi:hypothetical protein
MQHARLLGTVLIAMATVFSASGAVAAQAASSDKPMPAALATGELVLEDVVDFTVDDTVGNSTVQRGRTMRFRSEMSDPRLSGLVVVKDHADRFFEGDPSLEPFLGDVLWGTVEIVNDGGGWTGTKVGITDAAADGRGVQYYELVGTGGYEGLSAVVFERENGRVDGVDRPASWSAQIIPGSLPPDR